MLYKHTKGFTLVELLIVIGVIGTLVAVLVIIFNPLTQFQKARDAKRKSDLREVANALEVFYEDHHAYPHGTPGNSTMDGVNDSGSTEPDVNPLATPPYRSADGPSRWGRSWNPYMSLVPEDPLSKNNPDPSGIGDEDIHYEYVPMDPINPTGPNYHYQGYCLYSLLERPNDPDVCNKASPASACPHLQTLNSAGAGIHCDGSAAPKYPCRFAICSPNETP